MVLGTLLWVSAFEQGLGQMDPEVFAFLSHSGVLWLTAIKSLNIPKFYLLVCAQFWERWYAQLDGYISENIALDFLSSYPISCFPHNKYICLLYLWKLRLQNCSSQLNGIQEPLLRDVFLQISVKLKTTSVTCAISTTRQGLALFKGRNATLLHASRNVRQSWGIDCYLS